jgi:3'(2'), 5'-bisphosphate nucleotidase/inositol polyphosphate 1-phosphatase
LLFQKVQKALLQSDVHSKSDKSPVTVADYG